jgi:RNA polymerase sigma-70 factor (ECF subfamily)
MDDVERAFRQAHGQAVATLVRVFGDISLAEDAVQDAFVTAIDRWPSDGIPTNPAGWIIATARNRAIDIVRRLKRGQELVEQVAADRRPDPFLQRPEEDPLVMRDDQLRLIFTCCHPAIRVEHQVALTLRLVAGLTPAEVARAFLLSEATLSKRLVRAKYKIKAANIAYRVPRDAELPARLRVVLSVLYLIYNAGADDQEGRGELRSEAIRLARALLDLMPDEPEATGLLALMLLCESRMPARGGGGDVVVLRDQDRSLWDRSLIKEGHDLVLACLRRGLMGPFQLQAAIHAVHCATPRFEDTDWATILRFYDRLVAITPTPVVVLNRAVVLAETEGPAIALDRLDGVAGELEGYHLLHATRAVMLEQLGRLREAAEAYDRAAELAPTPAQVRFLARKYEEIVATGALERHRRPTD